MSPLKVPVKLTTNRRKKDMLMRRLRDILGGDTPDKNWLFLFLALVFIMYTLSASIL